MLKLLFAWIGKADLDAADGVAATGLGPLAQALEARPFDRAVLLTNYAAERGAAYVAWLRKRTDVKVEFRQVSLKSPTDYEAIYRVASTEVERALGSAGRSPALTFHLSPGTPAMAAIWIILSKTRHAAELIESSKQHGVQTAHVPFEMSAELIPELVRGADASLARLEEGLRPTAPEFSDILHRSPVMKRLLQRAEQCAAYSAPVLLQGESGTGKEMLASALHKASPRNAKPFVVVNCGAIAPELVESEFFGHEKGAFTGATKDRAGHFESAHGGTIFLDEIGELPHPAQVKLLRVLQEKKVVRVGSSAELTVDVRVLAATNRDLAAEVAAGRFREDLFYRLAVLVLHLPPLRERHGDVGPLVDAALERLNAEGAREGRAQKKLSLQGRNLLLQHPWSGNVRELHAVLLRTVVFSRRPTIDEEEVREALAAGRVASRREVSDLPLEVGFNLEALLDGLSREYLKRALAQSDGKKKAAAELLGFASYQTLSNWMKKLGVEA